jgi:hypothetical protein
MQELAGLRLADARLSVWKAQIWESAALPTKPWKSEWHEWKIMQPPLVMVERKLVKAIVMLSPISPPPMPCQIPNDRLQEFLSLLGPSLIWLTDPALGRLHPGNPTTANIKSLLLRVDSLPVSKPSPHPFLTTSESQLFAATTGAISRQHFAKTVKCFFLRTSDREVQAIAISVSCL